jgi:hypothetical protein
MINKIWAAVGGATFLPESQPRGRCTSVYVLFVLVVLGVKTPSVAGVGWGHEGLQQEKAGKAGGSK